jgi:bifunctional non-homologous end joining protein LigD
MALVPKPMLAFPADRPVVVPTGPNWILEPKYDGIRFLVHKDAGGVVRCYGGRNGSDHTGNAPAIEDHVAEYMPSGTWLDGELVDGDGMLGVRGESSNVQRFMVFDVLELGGKDIRHQPFRTRREWLETMDRLGMFGDVVQLTKQYEPSQFLYEGLVRAGWEGMVAKTWSGLYRPGKRSRDWMKLKHDDTVEAVITGYEMGKGESNSDRVGALRFKFVDNGVESTAGFDYDPAEVEQLFGKHVEVAHMGTFPSGSRRHPRIVKFRPDRDGVEA